MSTLVLDASFAIYACGIADGFGVLDDHQLAVTGGCGAAPAGSGS